MDSNQPTRTNKQGSIPSLYVLKAICAYAVVALHAPIGVASELIITLGQISVPIFFMVTGYFLYSEEREQLSTRLKSSIKKVAIIWLILNIVLTATSWGSIPPFHDWVLWAKWVLMGHHPSYGHLWYITSLLETLIFFYILTRLRLGKYLYIFTAFWLLRIIFGDLRPVIFGSPDSMMSCNFVMTGIPYMATGILIKQFPAISSRLSHLSGIGIPVFIGLAVLAAYGPPDSSPWAYTLKSFSKIGLMLSCFLFALRKAQLGYGSTSEYIGKSLSGNIYYWHGSIIALCAYILSDEIYSNWGAIIVAILSTIVAYFVVKLQKLCKVNYLP